MMNMPTQERKFYIAIHIENMERQKEKIEELKEEAAAKASSKGKGTKTRTISGEGVKAYSGKK